MELQVLVNYNGLEDGVRWRVNRWMSSRWRHEWIFEGSDEWLQKAFMMECWGELMVWENEWNEWMGDLLGW